MIYRALVIWLLIAAAEVLQGVLRVRLLNPRVGDHRARQIAVFTGSAIIVLITWLTAPWLDVRTVVESLAVGLLWLLLMLALEIVFGRMVFRMPWKKIAEDFDLRRGRLLLIGMFILFIVPLLVAKLRGQW